MVPASYAWKSPQHELKFFCGVCHHLSRLGCPHFQASCSFLSIFQGESSKQNLQEFHCFRCRLIRLQACGAKSRSWKPAPSQMSQVIRVIRASWRHPQISCRQRGIEGFRLICLASAITGAPSRRILRMLRWANVVQLHVAKASGKFALNLSRVEFQASVHECFEFTFPTSSVLRIHGLARRCFAWWAGAQEVNLG